MSSVFRVLCLIMTFWCAKEAYAAANAGVWDAATFWLIFWIFWWREYFRKDLK